MSRLTVPCPDPNCGPARSVRRQCPSCDKCRDCGYTHVNVECPDPNPDFDGTCLCDPVVGAHGPDGVRGPDGIQMTDEAYAECQRDVYAALTAKRKPRHNGLAARAWRRYMELYL